MTRAVQASRRPILIAGAGIAGLAAAIALARKGQYVRILERRAALDEAGAGIQIGPNGVKALEHLGVRGAIEPVASRPGGIAIGNGRTGVRLCSLPIGVTAEQRYGAPYLTLLRADLQSALLEAARKLPQIAIEFGFELTGSEQTAKAVLARAADGRSVEGTALVAGDGLWSRVRELEDGRSPKPTGYTAYRALIPWASRPDGACLLPAPFQTDNVCLWLGRDAHVVHYPVAGGTTLNLVVIVAAPPAGEGYDEPGATADISPHLARWTPELRQLLALAPIWRRWTVFDSVSAQSWSHDRILRVGDAAHPVQPFLAQGAVMALEDAVVLADLWPDGDSHPGAAFARFEALRRPRTERVAAMSRRNGVVYHMTGLGALARDSVLRWTSGARLLHQFDWLYGFDPRPRSGSNRPASAGP